MMLALGAANWIEMMCSVVQSVGERREAASDQSPVTLRRSKKFNFYRKIPKWSHKVKSKDVRKDITKF